MKKIPKKLSVLSLLLLSLGTVSVADAALKAFSPNPALITNPPVSVQLPNHVAGPVPLGGIPAWYQDINGVAVQTCLVPATCGLIGLGDPMFNEALPLSYPDNFPSEAFYTDVVAIFGIGLTGAIQARVVLAMEYTFIDATTGALIAANPRPANALGVPFQRHRLILSYPPGEPVPTAGNFTIGHPWGSTVFTFGEAKCVNNAGGQKCTMTRDLPLPGAIPPNFAAALGTGVVGTQSTFVRDPLAPAGFLGAATAVASFVGADVAAGGANSISATDGLGNTGSSAALTLLVGQTIGMEILPGANIDHGGINVVTANAAGTVLVPKTVTITNTTGNPITFPALVVAGTDVGDFTISPPAAVGAVNCSGNTIPIVDPAVAGSGTCSFDITFKPAAAAKAVRTATINLAPTVVAPAVPPPPITVNLTGTALVDVTSAAVGHGTLTPGTQAVGAGTAVTLTAAPSNKKFKVKDVVDGPTVLSAALTDPTSFSIANVGAVNHTVTATFMPSGDLNQDGKLDIADAQKALKLAVGIQAADSDDPDNTAVDAAPLVGGVPAPDAKVGVGDVVVILRRVLNLDNW